MNMEEFVIVVNGKNFNFKKGEEERYIITPFDENIDITDLSNALIKQKKYYIESYGERMTEEVKSENKFDDEDEVIPFNHIDKCYIVKIKKSGLNKI